MIKIILPWNIQSCTDSNAQRFKLHIALSFLEISEFLSPIKIRLKSDNYIQYNSLIYRHSEDALSFTIRNLKSNTAYILCRRRTLDTVVFHSFMYQSCQTNPMGPFNDSASAKMQQIVLSILPPSKVNLFHTPTISAYPL